MKDEMSQQRWNLLMSLAGENQRLTPEEIAQGYHFCHEFDGLMRTNQDEEYKCDCQPKPI